VSVVGAKSGDESGSTVLKLAALVAVFMGTDEGFRETCARSDEEKVVFSGRTQSAMIGPVRKMSVDSSCEM